jgi:hypothetical protein
LPRDPLDEFQPAWVEPSTFSLGRDPLGFQAASVRMYRELVPGLNNVTNRLRYYSYYCWVILTYQNTQHSSTEARWKKFIRRAEAFYVLACQLAGEEKDSGLAGAKWVSQFRDKGIPALIELSRYTDRLDGKGRGQYLRARFGNFGQFFKRTMTEVGMLEPSDRVPAVSRPRGEDLANAFAQSVGTRNCYLITRVLVDGRVRKRDVETIGKAIHPGAIEEKSQEMKLLREFLLAATPDKSAESGAARRSSAWLLLDLLRHGVSLGDRTSIRRALYDRRLPDDIPYGATGRTIDKWRAYQANEICHLTLELWLNAIALRLRSSTTRTPPNELIAQLLGAAFAERELRGTWLEWASRTRGDESKRDDELLDSVIDAHARFAVENTSALSGAIKLLGSLWLRWGGGADGVLSETLRQGVGNRSLGGVLQTFNEHQAIDVREAIAVVINKHVIHGHLLVAAIKLGAAGQSTYRFMLTDGVLSDGVVADYGYTSPRLNNLARFLRDAKLCDRERVTAAGLRFLNGTEPL